MFLLKIGNLYVSDHPRAEFGTTDNPEMASVFDSEEDVALVARFFGTTPTKAPLEN